MRIQCPHCGTGYQIDESRILPQGSPTRCKKCQARFLVRKKPMHKEQHELIQSEKQTVAERKPSGTEAHPKKAADDARKGEDEFSFQEQLVEQHLAQNDQNAAAKILFELIVKYSKKRNFGKAEALRDKLYTVAPMALNEIVKSGEIIEEEKCQSMDQKHLERWAKMYGLLDSDEINELYFAMKTETFRAGQAVYRQGQYNPNLYFVQEGRLKVVYLDRKNQGEIFLKELRSSHVANIDPFFSSTVSTATLIAISEAKLTYLEKGLLSKWEEKFPSLETKLYKFCQTQSRVGDLVKKAGVNLRAHPRVRTSLKAMIQLIDNKGKAVKDPLRVSLHDISAGGLCYIIRLNTKDMARQLLGHHLIMQTVYSSSKGKQTIQQKGRIVAVNMHPFGEASVHVQFENLLDQKVVDAIALTSPGL